MYATDRRQAKASCLRPMTELGQLKDFAPKSINRPIDNNAWGISDGLGNKLPLRRFALS